MGEEDTFAKLKAALARQEASLKGFEFKILVWAPGDEIFSKKRQEIIDRLTQHGFQAFTSEELAERFPSTLPLPEQELWHWKFVDLVIVLEAGVAPAMEVARYASYPEFLRKCIIWHHRDWDPARQTNFPSEILKLFANRVLYADEEMKKCTLTQECLHRAEAARHCSLLEGSPEAKQPMWFA